MDEEFDFSDVVDKPTTKSKPSVKPTEEFDFSDVVDKPVVKKKDLAASPDSGALFKLPGERSAPPIQKKNPSIEPRTDLIKTPYQLDQASKEVQYTQELESDPLGVLSVAGKRLAQPLEQLYERGKEFVQRVPATLQTGLGLFLEDKSEPSALESEADRNFRKSLTQKTTEFREAGLRKLNQLSEESSKKPLIRNFTEVQNAGDLFNWIGGTAGEQGLNIPAAVLSRGVYSGVLEASNNYQQNVNAIAKKKGISVEEVQRRGLDKPGLAAATGAFQGSLDAVGAGKIMSLFKPASIMRKVIGIGTEVGTELLQEQSGKTQTALATGEPVSKSLLTGKEALNVIAPAALMSGAASAIGGHPEAQSFQNNPTIQPNEQVQQPTQTTASASEGQSPGLGVSPTVVPNASVSPQAVENGSSGVAPTAGVSDTGNTPTQSISAGTGINERFLNSLNEKELQAEHADALSRGDAQWAATVEQVAQQKGVTLPLTNESINPVASPDGGGRAGNPASGAIVSPESVLAPSEEVTQTTDTSIPQPSPEQQLNEQQPLNTEDNATQEGQLAQNYQQERTGTSPLLREEGDNRNVSPEEQPQGDQTGSSDSVQPGSQGQEVAASAQALEENRPIDLTEIGQAVKFVFADGSTKNGNVVGRNADGTVNIKGLNGLNYNSVKPDLLQETPYSFLKGQKGVLPAPSGSKKSIFNVMATAPVAPSAAAGFNFNERVKQVLTDIGVPVAEKSLPRRFAGLFKLRSQNVRVQSLGDLFTAAHEATHYISTEGGLGAKVRPDKATIKQLTSIYQQHYPSPSKSADVNTRIEEGIATLLENYLYDPATISQQYPGLVRDFISPNGKYYHPQFTQLLDGMNNLLGDFSALSPEEQLGSRVLRGKEVVEQESGFTTAERAKFELVNTAAPLRSSDRQAGVLYTDESTEVAHNRFLARQSLTANWVEGTQPALIYNKSGKAIPLRASVKEYMKLVKNKEKPFSSYLVARRALGDFNELVRLQNEAQQLTNAIGQSPTPKQIQQLKEATDAYEKQKQLVDNDDFNIQQVTAVVNQYENEFKKPTELFDRINQGLITYAENTGLLSKEDADKYRANTTYASFQRFIDDELNGLGALPAGRSSQKKVSSFKTRSGSDLQIVDPVYSQIGAINETIGKGLQNIIWQKLAALGDKNVELARRFELMPTAPAVDENDKVTYPQDNDKSLIKVWADGKRQYYKAAPELLSYYETLSPNQADALFQALKIASDTFTRMTTSANPLWIAPNLTIDTITAATNTKTGMIPVVSQLATVPDLIGHAVDWVKRLDATIALIQKFQGKTAKQVAVKDLPLFRKYLALGGSRQLFTSQYDLSPQEVSAKLSGNESRLKKIARGVVNTTFGILEMPANTSEYMTRFAEFSRAIKQGDTEAVAMYKAAQVTINFAQRGNLGGKGSFANRLLSLLPYYGASLQVSYKFLSQAKDNPGRLATVAAGTFASALTMAIASMEFGDDEDKRLLAGMTVQDLSRAIYIPQKLWGGKGFLKMRVPEQLGAITGMAYMYIISNYNHNKYTFRNYLDSGTQLIPNQFNVTSKDNAARALFAHIPQAAKPTIEAITNTRTYPSIAPIVPDYMKLELPEYQYDKYTSKVAVQVGQQLGLSPKLIDYWAKNQFGSVPSILIGSKEVKNPLLVQEKDYQMRGKEYADFYKLKALADQQYNSLDKMEGLNFNDKQTIKNQHEELDKIAKILSEMWKKTELSEASKQSAFELLKAANEEEMDIMAVRKQRIQLSVIVQTLPEPKRVLKKP